MKKVLVTMVCACIVLQAFAKENCIKKVESTASSVPTVEKNMNVTEDCEMNVSLFHESVKQKNFADALEPWRATYKDCPSANHAIYTDGEKIMDWLILNEKDAAKKAELVNELMALYDNWVVYYGTYAKFPKGRILGRKGCAYVENNPSTKTVAYDWLKESVDLQGAQSEINALQQFIFVSLEKYKQDASFAEQFINDYLQASEILDVLCKDNTAKNYAAYVQVKTNIDNIFAISGAADCATMDNIFASKVDANASDIKYLENIISCYERLRCNESSVFFKASAYAHKIKPSAKSANGCAEMSYKSEKYEDAIAYYKEAIEMATEAVEKASYQFKIAQIYSGKLNKYSLARDFARQAISNDPSNGKPYLLIGNMYAQSKIYDDPILQKSVYWVAVDKFEKAKSVDSECTEDANKMISVYRQYYPTTEEIFFHNELEAGKSFTVGGWIGETTRCRD